MRQTNRQTDRQTADSCFTFTATDEVSVIMASRRQNAATDDYQSLLYCIGDQRR